MSCCPSLWPGFMSHEGPVIGQGATTEPVCDMHTFPSSFRRNNVEKEAVFSFYINISSPKLTRSNCPALDLMVGC